MSNSIKFLVVTIAVSVISACSTVKLERVRDFRLRENTTYTVKRSLDLRGQSLRIPVGSKLVFKGGSIANGSIVFNSNVIKGEPRFINCNYDGKICIKEIDDRDFTSSEDTKTLIFLVSNAISNGAKCDLYRDYKICMQNVGSTGLINFSHIKSGAEITFHGNTIYNTSIFQSYITKPVIVLQDVCGITIKGCNFHDADAHNTHNFKESTGCTFIQCYGDCNEINLFDCRQENGDCFLRSGVWIHDVKNPGRTPSKGLTNSILRVKSLNTGYGLALYGGDKLNITIDAESPHRGFYCAGVSNSTIRYKGYNPIETKCHILIKDAVFRKKDNTGKEVLDMKGCHDLAIEVSIDELLSGENVIMFQSYGSGRKENADFRFRSGKCHHYNVDFTAAIKHYPNDGFYTICGVFPDSGALNDDDMYGCKVTGITIHDIKGIGGSATKYMCNIGAFTESDISIINCEVDDLNSKNGYNFQVAGNAAGNVLVKNGRVGYVLVRRKDNGNFNMVLDNTQLLGGFNYINDRSLRQLVQIKKR